MPNTAPPTVCYHGMEEVKITGVPAMKNLRDEALFEVASNTKKETVVDISFKPAKKDAYILLPVSLLIGILNDFFTTFF